MLSTAAATATADPPCRCSPSRATLARTKAVRVYGGFAGASHASDASDRNVVITHAGPALQTRTPYSALRKGGHAVPPRPLAPPEPRRLRAGLDKEAA
ncbi:hypothetical protein [Streptomyces xylophagus]|uniref:hypothetical protein n=1 Tax=Streptomyces xylophagus TaxID=285514 RepID=UPI001F306EBF|nr:hypothetical protein [Streptomyces xylophagus]